MDSNLSIATIRSLCIDMINKANSGHPGMVLDGAPALYTLFTKVMNIIPLCLVGKIGIALFLQVVMLVLYFMLYYIFLVMI